MSEENSNPPLNEVIKKKRTRSKTNDRDYISNPEFTKAVGEWAATTRGLERKDWPKMPDFVGECIMKLVSNYSNKNNFRGYTYIDEMRSEATLNCVRYAHNFDLNKSTNAFAYFTQLIHNSFLQVLGKEKVQAEIKFSEVSAKNSGNDYKNINLFRDEE